MLKCVNIKSYFDGKLKPAVIEFLVLVQSDSDDIGPTAGVHRHLAPFSLQAKKVAHLHGNIESDSFNENFSPVHPNTRRYVTSTSFSDLTFIGLSYGLVWKQLQAL